MAGLVEGMFWDLDDENFELALWLERALHVAAAAADKFAVFKAQRKELA
jgi:hypothetical protein